MFICPECAARLEEAGVCPAHGARLVDASTDPLLGQQVGSYYIASRIGAGGMGAVYKAVQPTIGGRVAIKVLSNECAASGEAVQRFFAEARAVNLIRHDNIVSVFDLAWLPSGQPYILMEYLEGRSMREQIAVEGPLGVAETVGLIVQVLDALSAAHGHHIVHRDIKPENVFITAAGRVKVLDFGVAKLRPEGSDGLTRPGQLLGTPHYMAPEQVASLPVDARADVYAVGLLLFETLTGRKAFDGQTPMELLQQHIRAAPPRPSSLRPSLPPALDDVVLRALAKDPSDRFASARAFQQALEQATGTLAAVPGRAVVATAASRPQQPRPSHQVVDALAPTKTPTVEARAATVAAGPHAQPPTVASSPHVVAPTVASGPHLGIAQRAPSRGTMWVVIGAVLSLVVLAAIGLGFAIGIAADRTELWPETADDSGQTIVDVTRALNKASDQAREAHPDAKLSLMTLNAVNVDGTVDLAAPSAGITFQFVSLADDACFQVAYSLARPRGMVDDWHRGRCAKADPLGLPRCSIKQLMRRAFPHGMPSLRLVVVNYGRFDHGTRWIVMASAHDGGAKTQLLPDDC